MAEQDSPLHTVRETELKLTVPADTDLAALIAPGGPVDTVEEPTTAVLSSTYFDTDDLRLAREGITLRERVGDDEGWHLKVPAGADGRHEIRAELGGSAPPVALLDLVAVYTRGKPVRRVTTLETTRVTRRLLDVRGELLAVVVDDAVRVLEGER
jgi:inorganic triphosphatase YgiF